MGPALADTLTYSSAVLPSTEADWSSFADLQQFNPTLGTLQQVTLTIQGDLSGMAAAESRNNKAAVLTLTLQAELSLARPDNTSVVLVSTTPLVSQLFSASIRDGVTDFAGTSGITLTNLSATSSNSASFTDASTLSLFTGTGTLQMPFGAAAQSGVSGAGNLAYDFSTYAGGRASVTYQFAPVELPPVPEPGTWALLLVGLAAIGWKSARRST
jgi:hypothetical protein